MELVVVLIIGVAVGAAAGFVVGRARSGAAPGLENLDVVRAHHATELAELRHAESRERALLQADLAQAQATAVALRDQVTQLTELRQRELADREKSQSDESKVLQQMAPIAKNLADMQRKVIEIEQQRAAQHGEMAEQIKHTRMTAEQSRAAAETLSSALRNNQVRGAYGEIQLESIVEAAGMIKRVDYTTQESINADSGARRPDMVVKLPGGKELAIDAKAPYNAFIEASRTDLEDAQRATLLKEHAKAVRSHVNALADKSYFTGLQSSPEFTVAFIPSDAILIAAVDTDPTLEADAYRKGVVLATPASLFGILKSLAYTWKQEDLAENAREVVSMGQVLFNRLSTVAKHASKLGRSIERSVKDYNAFAGSMQTQLLTQARRFDGMEFETPKEIEDGTRQFTAAEFAALEELDDVARPELEFLDIEPGGGLGAQTA
ncbi:MAG TPA: DNA recombination protein RmuC [Aeromicrobium sp.]|nr:DNA recombination protein RmuC [Aeromicrobium sp.]